ncbi:hypothetical protein [Subtercola lobariae]|nr:hypothetical protein [Subtercola lobariae]
MAPLQLVLSHSEVELVANSENRAPSSFEDAAHDVRVPRLGAPELVLLAQQAKSAGYRLNSFEIAGPDLKLVRDAQLEEELSAELVAALESHGTSAVFSLLRHEFHGYAIAGVRLYRADTKIVTIRRNGVVLANGPEGVLEFVRSAWKKVSAW